jgi:membrane-associated protease RseP (regulator of RpoE activity)
MCNGNNPPATPVNHSIILKVNTSGIPAPENPPNNVDAYCSFEGQTGGVTNENFEVSVANGDTVTWSGVPNPANANDVIKITEIDYEAGTNLFGTADLSPIGGAATITGTIANLTTTDVETYTIKFEVYNNSILKSSGGTSVYQIDPKLKMKQKAK